MFQKAKSFLKQIVTSKTVSVVFIPIIISSLVTFYFNSKIEHRVSQREFIYNFSRVFFDNPKYRNVSVTLEEAYLDNKKPILKINGGPFSDYDIDDYLSLLYDLYAYGEEGIVSYRIINDQFHYYVCITYNNREIQEYRKRLIKEGFSGQGAHNYLDDFAIKLGISSNDDCKAL